MNYILKYIKYKNKYLKLKQTSGAKNNINEFYYNIDKKEINNINNIKSNKTDIYSILDLRIKIINFNDMNEEIFNSLIAILEKNENKMCIYNNIKTQKIFEEISRDYNMSKSFISYQFIYLYSSDNLDEIKGYALIDNKFNNIIELVLLCSNELYKNAGKYLLNYIYDNYIYNKNNLLIIRPATRELIKYYESWKKPTFPLNMNELNKTYHFLIYGNINLLKNNEISKKLIYDLNFIDVLKKYIIISDTELYDLPIDEFKKNIIKKINSLSIDESHKNQLLYNLESIKIRTNNELFNN